MKQYTHLLWDFNGTLLDDLDACIRSANRLLTAHGLQPLSSVEQYRSIFGFPIMDYYRRLGFDFDRIPYDTLAVEWVGYYMENAADAGLYPDVRETLSRVRACGVSQLILSATEREMLRGQVASLGIDSCFDGLLGMGTIHAHSKEEIARAWRAEHPNARVLVVGDTDHDASVAQAIGADCILVARGHQSREHLLSCRATCVIDSLSELIF